MKILSLVIILFILGSCSGGGEGGGESKTKKLFDRDGLPAGEVVEFLDFQKLVSNHDPLSGSSYTFNGDFSFDKKKSLCSGNIKSKIDTTKAESTVTTNGYCKFDKFSKRFNSTLELLNLDKFHEALGEALKVVELGGNEYRISFEDQKNWTRSYTFKIDKKAKTILFPVTLRYRFNDGASKMKWAITIKIGQDGPGRSTASEKSIDAMDLAEQGLIIIF